MLLKFRNNFIAKILNQNFSTSSILYRRPPPIEEFENNIKYQRKKTAEPFDRRWRWTPKSAEPYNIYGGDIRWTKLPFLRRGVQIPGYIDKKTEKFVHIEEMVPEIIVPNLKDCKLKPYVPYNVEDIKQEPFTAKRLFELTYEKKLKVEFEKEYEKLNINKPEQEVKQIETK